jgi:AcrR family transcriptional regulator
MVYRRTERSEKVRQASRQRMLRAARRLFAKRGYAATTMREIAAAAETSIGNLYFYFRNKDELLGTLFRETRTPIWKWIEDTTKHVPAGASRMAIAAYANSLRLLRGDRDLMRIFVLEGIPVTLAQSVMNEHLLHWRALWLENFPDYPPQALEMALSAWAGSLRRCVERSVLGELDGDPETVAEFIARWNLRAAGVPEHEIDAAVSTAVRLAAEYAIPVARH